MTQRETPGSLVTQSRAENLDRQREWTLSVTAPYSPWKWWAITNALSASYATFFLNSVANAPRTVQGAGGVYSIANDFAVDGGWVLSASGYFQSPIPQGVTHNRGQASAYLGDQKKFLDDRPALRVTYSDIFRSARAVTRTDFASLRTNSTYRWDSNYCVATLTYQLGNQKGKSRQQKPQCVGR